VAIILKNKAELKLMRRSGRVAQRILNELGAATKAGVTPKELDALARRLLEANGARSPFLGKRVPNAPAYPAQITVSVNDVVVHGIPDERPFREGDLVSLDVGVLLNGFIGDTAGTFCVGEPSPRAERLMRVTREALFKGINKAVIGNSVGDISYAIQNHVEAHGYNVVRELVGHGVGRSMHEEPNVPNYGRPGTGPRLKAGMTIAIEPMVNEGTSNVRHLADKWTVVTADGSLSCHFEHTVAVLTDGPEILTVDED
jgi:methionyl aminopeptidase